MGLKNYLDSKFEFKALNLGRRLCSLLIVVLGLSLSGCTPPNDPMLGMLETELKKTKIDDLSRTMDFIFSEVQFEQKEFKDNLSSGLNRWISYSDEKLSRVDWKSDELSQPLLDSHESLAMLAQNDEYSFLGTDAHYLQESAWIGQIVDRVVGSNLLSGFELYRLAAGGYKPNQDTEDPLREVVSKLHPELELDNAQKLTDSLKVFDWIIRNIQLVENSSSDLDDDAINAAALNKSDGMLAQRGVAGLGYKRYPWQTLLYGQADYVERAKLFMLALRQLEIDAVMLTPTAEGGQPWAVGVAIGGQYYLFDTKLGLPFPGEKTGTIATLSQVRQGTSLLSRLDLTTDESLEDDTEYWVKPDDVKELVGLVYVTPESISKRMLALEQSLIGEKRLTLAFNGDGIMQRLPAVDGVEIKSWDIAIKTHLFRQAVREALGQKSSDQLQDRLRWHFQDESYIDNFVIYRTSRARFFKGKFQSQKRARSLNAIESAKRLMYSDDDLEEVATNKNLQRLLGIRKDEDQSADQFLGQVKSVQGQMRLMRRDAGFHLTQCLFDNASVNAAKNWLNVLKDQDGVERWSDGVGYLLGRALEGCKEYDEAIEALGDTDSVQAHGNIIRQRMLKELVEQL